MSVAVVIPIFDPAAPKGCIQNMEDMERALVPDTDYIAFIHSDVTIHDNNWHLAVENFFRSHPRCGLVGFGGAVALGDPDLYKKRYQLIQLARFGYASNQDDWQVHGDHLEEPCRVAVLDGFFMCFRRTPYEQMGGWQRALDLGLMFHCYDTFACCMMARLGWEVWALPVPCLHRGGAVSILGAYDAWLRTQGLDGDVDVHQRAHKVIYNEFKDVLPLKV